MGIYGIDGYVDEGKTRKRREAGISGYISIRGPEHQYSVRADYMPSLLFTITVRVNEHSLFPISSWKDELKL
jgi:hypothetical protein